jgi:hypothetical protein
MRKARRTLFVNGLAATYQYQLFCAITDITYSHIQIAQRVVGHLAP